MEKYLQDAEQCRALEVNYFDDNDTCQNKEPNPEYAEQTIQFSKDNQMPPSQTFTADTNVARDPSESLKSDTGHTSRQRLPVHTDADEKCQQIKTSEDISQDAKAQHPMKETPEETTSIESE